MPNEARQLSLLLRAGALIAPIQIVEANRVDPRAGKILPRGWGAANNEKNAFWSRFRPGC
jgi:hypothetical protein